ncbi:hypothetical protein ECFRIK1985_2495, partial [Escherichia coli FRIK1985]
MRGSGASYESGSGSP